MFTIEEKASPSPGFMKDHVFISYAAEDKTVADALCALLEGAGIRCWIAPRDITPGRVWSEAIIDAINESRVMILIFSRHSNKSPQVWREVERAVNRGMLLLKVRLEDIKPSRALELFISSSHWLDAFPPPVERHLAGLPATIKRLVAESHPTEEREAIQFESLEAELRARGQIRSARGLRKSAGKLSPTTRALIAVGVISASVVSIVTANKFLAGTDDQTNKSSGSPFAAESAGISMSIDSQPAPVSSPPPASPPPAETAATKTTANNTRTAGKTTGAAIVRNPPASTSTVRDTSTRNASGPVIPIRPPDPAAVAEVARVCVTALMKRDTVWLSNHYGTHLTVVDEKNVKTLSELLRNKGYKPQILSNPVAADGVVSFTMQFQYVTNFGTTPTRTVEFQVQTLVRLGNPELANCRVKGTLKL
jgi:hypothetical protein